MKCMRIVLLLGLILLTGSATVLAKAENGFGLFGGFASHTSKGEFTQAPFSGTKFEFTSQGLSIGLDYQFAIGDSFSISPFLISSSETFTEESNIFTATDGGGHAIIGVQARVWFDSLFVGGHGGRYNEVIRFTSVGEVSSVGIGYDLVVGWEGDGGLFFSFQTDRATLDDGAGTEIDLVGNRLHIGYRWK